MVFHVTELRNQIFRIFKMVDAGEDVTIIKKDSNKRYRIVVVEELDKKDIVKIAEEMSKIGLKTKSPSEMKKTFEGRYE
jgi:hypothetical protein